MPTETIYGSKMIYISSGSPSSTFTPGSIVNVDDGYGQSSYNTDEIRAYMSFNIPETIKRKKILNGTFYVYARSDDPNGLLYTPIDGGYRDDINWNNKPRLYYNYIKLGENSGFAWRQKYYGSFRTEPSYMTGALRDVLLNGVRFGHDGRGAGQLYTPYSSNKPYVVVEYENISLDAFGSPNSGFVDKHKAITLTVNAYTLKIDAIQIPVLSSAVIKWRDGVEGEWHELAQAVETTKERAVFQLPANSITASTLEWSIVSVTSDDGIVSNFSEVYNLSTVDAISTAVPLSPVNDRIDVESKQAFTWQHVITTGSDPTGYDLEYSTDGAAWQTLESKTGTADTECAVPAMALPAGKLWWRVRTYNGDGIAGEWSEPAAIIGYGAPPAPIISEVTNSARPTIRWQSATQIAYELIIRQGDAELLHVGETAGTGKSYTVPVFLNDGNYTVSVRIENGGLYWSNWANAAFAVQTKKPDPPTISGTPAHNGVLISTEAEGGALYLLRDGIPIGRLYNGLAADYTAVGPHTYVVRIVNEEGAYADSTPLTLETKIQQAVIAPAEDPGNMIGPLLQVVENEYPSTASLSTELKYYAGRKYPVAVTDGAISEEYAPVFAALNTLQWRALRKLMEESAAVLYRNSAGDCAYCIIAALNPTKAWNGYTTWEMTMQRIDYVERVDYDGVV